MLNQTFPEMVIQPVANGYIVFLDRGITQGGMPQWNRTHVAASDEALVDLLKHIAVAAKMDPLAPAAPQPAMPQTTAALDARRKQADKIAGLPDWMRFGNPEQV